MGMLDWGKEKVKQVGRGLLGAGTGSSDATPEMRRYRVYEGEARAMGIEPKTYEEWIKTGG